VKCTPSDSPMTLVQLSSTVAAAAVTMTATATFDFVSKLLGLL